MRSSMTWYPNQKYWEHSRKRSIKLPGNKTHAVQSCDVAPRGRRWIVMSHQNYSPWRWSDTLEEDLEPGRLAVFILKFSRGMEGCLKGGNIDVHMCGCDFGKEFEVLKDVMLGKWNHKLLSDSYRCWRAYSQLTRKALWEGIFPDPWYDLGFHLCIDNINSPVNGGVWEGSRVIGLG